jgi:hypothetical protein
MPSAFGKKGTRLTIRMNEAVPAAVASAAVEDKRTMAEVVSEVLAGWAVRRELAARLPNRKIPDEPVQS